VDHQPLAMALREGHPAQGSFRVRLNEGALQEVEVSALPLLEPDFYEGARVVFWPVEDAAPETT
jgi:hypothetical protein